MIKLIIKGFISIQMAQNISENGLMINNTVKVLRHGQMVLSIKAITKTEKNMVKI